VASQLHRGRTSVSASASDSVEPKSAAGRIEAPRPGSKRTSFLLPEDGIPLRTMGRNGSLKSMRLSSPDRRATSCGDPGAAKDRPTLSAGLPGHGKHCLARAVKGRLQPAAPTGAPAGLGVVGAL
jgi:hypothetical protein